MTVGIRLRIVVLVAGLLVPTIAVLATISGVRTGALERSAEADALAAAASRFDAAIEQRGDQLESLVRTLVTTPTLQAAIASADTQAALAFFDRFFPTLKDDYGITNMQAHLPPATSLARAHRPDRFGDDMSALRPMLVAVNRDQRVIRGIELGRFGLPLRAMAPVMNDGRHVGSLEVGAFLDTGFLDRVAPARTRLQLVVEQPDGSRQLVGTSDVGDLPLVDEASLEAALRGEAVRIDHATADGRIEMRVARPLRDWADDPLGVVIIALDVTDARNQGARTTRIIIVAATALLVIAGGVGMWVAGGISQPVIRLTETMARLADRDWSVKIPGLARGDEVGRMARAVEVLKENGERADQLEAGRREADARAAAARQSALVQMADRFEQSVGAIVDTVGAAAADLERTAHTMQALAQQTGDQASTVADASEQTSTNVETVAASAEQLNASISEIAAQVTTAATITVEARVKASDSNTRMTELATEVEDIGKIVELIQTIAGQTNLLALNATIESARAGDAGKGFAVVANEVKALATQTQQATERIRGQIEQIQEQTRRSAEVSREIVQIVDQVGEISQSISSAVEEQSAATGEIARIIAEAAGGTRLVSGSVQNVMQAASETNTAASTVADAAERLDRDAARLRDAVADFLREVRIG